MEGPLALHGGLRGDGHGVAWLHGYAVHQMLSLPLCSSESAQNDASRGRHHSSPCGRGGGGAYGMHVFVTGCLFMVPHVSCSSAAGTKFQLLPFW